jgi:hypothetical protein
MHPLLNGGRKKCRCMKLIMHVVLKVMVIKDRKIEPTLYNRSYVVDPQ